jgi:hypothetical protein
MKCLFALLICLPLCSQTAPRPDPKDPKFKSSDEYIEALTDWKVQQKMVPVKIPPCATVIACNKQIKAERENIARIQDARDLALSSLVSMTSERDIANKKYNDALAILETLASQIKGEKLTDSQQKALSQVQPGKALDLGISVEKDTGLVFTYATKLQQDYKSKAEAYDSLVDRYNSTLQQANNIINAQNARLARQQQINNALAIFSAMPKSQPYQLPPPPVFNSKAINCTSNQMGTTTYTNCN